MRIIHFLWQKLVKGSELAITVVKVVISYLFHKLFLDDFIKKKIWNVRDVMGHGAKNFMIGTNVNFFGQD